MLVDLYLRQIISTSLGFRELDSSRGFCVVIGQLNRLEHEFVGFVFERADQVFSFTVH